MKKTLAIAAGLLLATATNSAFAQPYYGGRQFRAPSPYTDYVRQMRACQRHDRLHREFGELHQDEHYEGFDSRRDHRDLHDELDEVHDAYHDDHPRADFCNRYIRGYGQPAYRSRSAPYGYGYGNGYGYAPGYYNNGLSFGFSFGN